MYDVQVQHVQFSYSSIPSNFLVSFRKCGRLVVVTLSFISTTDIAVDTAICNIPSLFTPNYNLTGTLCCVGSDGSGAVLSLYKDLLTINVASVSPKIKANVYYGGTCSYYIAAV